MKNLTKALVAGALGLAVIAGSAAGTFATWQHSDTAQAGTITTGDLSIQVGETGEWVSDLNGRSYPNLSDVIFVPGEQVRTNVLGLVSSRGLSLHEVTVTSSVRGDLRINDDGYLLREDWTPTQLRFQLEESFNLWAGEGEDNVRIQLTVAFDRQTDFEGMYDNGITDFDLGEITVTVTQN